MKVFRIIFAALVVAGTVFGGVKASGKKVAPTVYIPDGTGTRAVDLADYNQDPETNPNAWTCISDVDPCYFQNPDRTGPSETLGNYQLISEL